MNSLKIENLKFTYFEENSNLIDDLSLTLSQSKITILTGRSGCGKSTLMYLAAGIYPEEAGVMRGGSITVDDENPALLTPDKRCRKIGVMFQNPELQFCMDTVRNELIFCMENIGMAPEDMDEAMDDALAFCGIEKLKERRLQTLSGGEKQKVMLSCIMVLNPGWLLLDEPFANIDEKSARIIAEKLKRLHKERNVGILAVDHRLDHWLDIADEIIVMKEGRIEDTIEMDGGSLKVSDEKKLTGYGVSVPGYAYSPVLSARRTGEAVVSLNNFSVSREKKEILKNISVSFHKGGSYAILGESGSGKSTLFSALSGVYQYKGNALLCGKEFRKLTKADIGKAGFITQNPQDQFVCNTVRQEIMTGLKRYENAEEVCEKILRKISLWRYRDISPYMLSQGQQRRLGTAALMAYPCEVLFCDEPTYAQDRVNTMAIMDALYQHTAKTAATLIFATHDRQLAAEYADVIFEMREGRLYEIV